jgi:hypothetical protein
VTSRSKTSSTNRQSSDNINNSRRAPVEASRDRDAKEAAEETDRDVGSVTLEIQDREREVEMELLALDDEIGTYISAYLLLFFNEEGDVFMLLFCSFIKAET